jgi:5-methylcytosine-specific restriction protein A
MPRKPPHPCEYPGCPQLVRGCRYCPAHSRAKAADYDARRKQADATAGPARLRGSVAWQKLRRMYTRANPVCCDPFGIHGSIPAPGQQVHHVQAIVDRPDLALAWDNLATLCVVCHARVEAMERGGRSTVHLFADRPDATQALAGGGPKS